MKQQFETMAQSVSEFASIFGRPRVLGQYRFSQSFPKILNTQSL